MQLLITKLVLSACSVMKSHQLRLLLRNVSQGQNSFNVNSVWQVGRSAAKVRQELHDCLNAARMSSIAQNFETDNEFLSCASGESTDNTVVDWLRKEPKNIITSPMSQLEFSHLILKNDTYFHKLSWTSWILCTVFGNQGTIAQHHNLS